jgi:hypothetical protein
LRRLEFKENNIELDRNKQDFFFPKIALNIRYLDRSLPLPEGSLGDIALYNLEKYFLLDPPGKKLTMVVVLNLYL